jgi:hypothetical protein
MRKATIDVQVAGLRDLLTCKKSDCKRIANKTANEIANVIPFLRFSHIDPYC